MTAHPGLELVDALGGLCTAAKRSATLDGSVPLRAAQACSPLLEGNAFGLQLQLTHPLALTRTLGSLGVAWVERSEAWTRSARAVVPMLVAQGLLPPKGWWQRHLAPGPAVARQGRASVWTGLLVRPPPGLCVRVAATANRRSATYDVEEQLLVGTGWVPIVLELSLTRGSRRAEVQGEVATLSLHPERVSLRRVALEEDPEAARAHVGFYDADYFDQKRRGSTRKYRRTIVKRDGEAEQGEGTVTLIEAGPVEMTVEEAPAAFDREGPVDPRGRLPRFVFHNALDFEVGWDGKDVALTWDARRLKALGERTVATWSRVVGPGAQDRHRGALLYLTKYFTPHPPGEPHFFVKPWALLRTPPGWSTLAEGRRGRGWEVLRGAVRTDVFHAVPAVFRLLEAGVPLSIRQGTPLLDLLSYPRHLDAVAPRVEALPWAARE